MTQWIVNASPLIVLGKADLLHMISPLAATWFIPNAVIEEVSQKSTIEPILKALSKEAEVICEEEMTMNQFVASWNLGVGESSVLNLALAKIQCGVVLDDLQARKCAKVLNLPLIGSLGLLVKAKKEGLITHIQPCFDKLISAGLYVDKNLIQHILSTIEK